MSDRQGTFNQALWRRRHFRERIARHGIAFGGMSVIIAVMLIFFYLLYVVMPIFKGASLEPVSDYALPAPAEETLVMALEEQGTVAVRYLRDGRVQFFDTADGSIRVEKTLPLEGARITAVAAPTPAGDIVAFATDDGRMLVVRHRFEVSYPDDVRTLTPSLEYPFGESLIEIDRRSRPLQHLAFRWEEEQAGAVAITGDGRLVFAKWEVEQSLLDDTLGLSRDVYAERPVDGDTVQVLVTPDQQFVYRIGRAGSIEMYEPSDGELGDPQTIPALADGEYFTVAKFLLGEYALLLADSTGRIMEWFPVRDENNRYGLKRIREFHAESTDPISMLAPEHRRKGFLAADQSGFLTVYATSGEAALLEERVTGRPIVGMALSARGETLLTQDDSGRLQLFEVHNEHPEISWSALWEKVWYEGYPEPDYIWQSSAATNDFEPKFSLVPLTFGTLKAAFYAMLFAIPLALLGAVYTAQFMRPTMRAMVKPTIEIMEALPTVILGFLAGLWLAPFIETHLPGFLTLLIMLPSGVLAASWLWFRLPDRLRNPAEGWEALLLLPLVCLLGWLAMVTSEPLGQWLFNGNVQNWLSQELGVHYDQRNAMVVGIAMGFAVIPTIFSIAEDAIFSVPGHLIRGSLALGATRWQTLVGVVLPTASPAIFSALMMGFGRAVGETMIVLMATGNTPIMDMSIFEGMRTLSANIAVEMPESEVNSSHYRVLFLAALVLFLFTFVFNTAAELVRQRLRDKYGSL